MKDIIALAIETSCDETSMSLVKNGTEEIATVVLSQIDIHKQFGGVVPEVASRSHIENVTIVLEELLQKTNYTLTDIDYVAVAYAPGLIGCLLIGLTVAKTLALVLNKPLVPVNHMAGHVYAANLEKRLCFPLVALIVSGGHTQLMYMKDDYSFKKIGETLDDAIGECYDKVAKLLGLDYPGGPIIDRLAHQGEDKYDLPYPLNDNTYNFSFSGIKSAVLNLITKEKNNDHDINISNLACTFQNRVLSVLFKKTIKALKEYNVSNLVIGGGVAANQGLRELFFEYCETHNINLYIPTINHCTDNAAMIGSASYYAYKNGIRADFQLDASSSENIYNSNN